MPVTTGYHNIKNQTHLIRCHMFVHSFPIAKQFSLCYFPWQISKYLNTREPPPLEKKEKIIQNLVHKFYTSVECLNLNRIKLQFDVGCSMLPISLSFDVVVVVVRFPFASSSKVSTFRFPPTRFINRIWMFAYRLSLVLVLHKAQRFRVPESIHDSVFMMFMTYWLFSE